MSSLQINIKDTLYLVPGLHMPFKFLHTPAIKNVRGAYVQVEPDPEGFGQPTFKIYGRRDSADPAWYPTK